METSLKLENEIRSLICKVLENKEDAKENLKNFVNALWTVRETLKESICSYNLLFAAHYYFNNDINDSRIKLTSEDKTTSIDFDKRTIVSTNHKHYNEITIHLNDIASEELLDFIYEHDDDEHKIVLKELTEKYEVEKFEAADLWV